MDATSPRPYYECPATSQYVIYRFFGYQRMFAKRKLALVNLLDQIIPFASQNFQVEEISRLWSDILQLYGIATWQDARLCAILWDVEECCSFVYLNVGKPW